MPYSSRAHKQEKRGAIAKKTAHLIHEEGKSPEQAYAMANSMARAGRLTKAGGYRRVKRG